MQQHALDCAASLSALAELWLPLCRRNTTADSTEPQARLEVQLPLAVRLVQARSVQRAEQQTEESRTAAQEAP